MVAYKISSKAYLSRARKQLDEDSVESLFYAAFELRCGIEARMKEYLEVQDHISKTKKKGWRIAKLGRNIEQAFKSGDKVIEVTIFHPETKKQLGALYYTPVTRTLQKDGEKLGDLLHAMNKYYPEGNVRWEKTKTFLEGVYRKLEKANKGTLLGPPLIQRSTGKVNMIEAANGENLKGALKELGGIGTQGIMEVRHLETLPE